MSAKICNELSKTEKKFIKKILRQKNLQKGNLEGRRGKDEEQYYYSVLLKRGFFSKYYAIVQFIVSVNETKLLRLKLIFVVSKVSRSGPATYEEVTEKINLILCDEHGEPDRNADEEILTLAENAVRNFFQLLENSSFKEDTRERKQREKKRKKEEKMKRKLARWW